MNNTKENILIVLGFAILAVLSFSSTALLNGGKDSPSVGAVTNYVDTSSNTITPATTTVSSAPTQVFSSITKFGQIMNNTTNTMTCVMDATGTTAASSTLVANRGIIVPPLASSTPFSTVSFGECYPGSVNCYAHKGAVNCLIGATSTITKWSK